jgi:hypothetical protein
VRSLPKPAFLKIQLDESRIAHGSVDRDSVQIEVKWRGQETEPAIFSSWNEVPKPIPDVVKLRRDDGEIKLVPAAWRTMRFSNGPSFITIARRRPGGLGTTPQLSVVVPWATQLIEHYHPNFSDWPQEQRTDYLMRTLDKLREASKGVEGLQGHLEHAGPQKYRAVPSVRKPERDVTAALLREVLDFSTLRIGEELEFSPPSEPGIKREHPAVRMAIGRGLGLLEHCFGVEGWQGKKRRMRDERARWLSMNGQPKQQFYYLLAELRGTSAEQEERIAADDGFDKLLDEWLVAFAASDHEDHRRAIKIQLSDPRFDALRRL